MTANVGWQLTQFFVGWMVLAVLLTAGVCWLAHRYAPSLPREVSRHPESVALRALEKR